MEVHPKSPGRFFFASLLLVLCGACAAASVQAAPPPLLTQFGQNCGDQAKVFNRECGTGGGETIIPRGLAIDPVSGNLIAADQSNNRIQIFTAWGEFVSASGGGVVTGGATGSGNVSAGSTVVTGVVTSQKSFAIGQILTGGGIAAGTEIVALGSGTITLSHAATTSGTDVALSAAAGSGNVPNDEQQTVTVTATGGSFKLTFETPNPSPSTATTANLPFNASAAEVQGALEGLANIGAGNVAVTSTTPGGEAGIPGGPYTVEFKGSRFSDTNVLQLKTVAGAPPLSGGSAVVATTVQGASAFEVCTVAADCRTGVPGNGDGQLGEPQGVAVDSAGNAYVIDRQNSRVQKFDDEGHFLLSFGSAGSGIGQFAWPAPNEGSSYIAVSPGDEIFVADKGRIQKFGPTGVYQGTFEAAALAGETVGSLAIGSDGDLYVARVGAPGKAKEGVLRLDSDTGTTVCTAEAENPFAIATDDDGTVYVVDQEGEAFATSEVLEFSSDCSPIDLGGSAPGFAGDVLGVSTGIATSSACGLEGADVFVANSDFTNSFVAVYGPSPDPDLCPPPKVAPTIADQYASAVDTAGATLAAKINPHFWDTTTYYLEYGTAPCSEGGCAQQPLAPGTDLGAGVGKDLAATALLSGLSPDTTYHYRFAARTVFEINGAVEGEAEVKGKGGTPAEDGAEGTFTTFPLPDPPSTACPNQADRIGAGSKLADCRAYEMVSPLDKNGTDVSTGGGSFALASTDGNRATFSAKGGFAGPVGAPLSSQYIAEREDGVAWLTHAISPPRTNKSLYSTAGLQIPYKAFSEDLCSGWVLQDTDVPLAAGAPEGVPNLYRRTECAQPCPDPSLAAEVGGCYELTSSVAPPGFSYEAEPEGSEYYPMVQGASADSTRTIFKADAALTPDACPTGQIFQLYESLPGGQLRLISARPNGAPVCTHSSLGTAFGGLAEFREDSVFQAASADATRVYWTAWDNGTPVKEGGASNQKQPGAIFLRINADQEQSKVAAGKCTEPEKACTLRVVEPIAPTPPAVFWGASTSGDRAYFTVGEELHEYDLATQSASLIAKGFLGVMGQSKDATRLYFASEEVLTGAEENSEGRAAEAGEANLYLYEVGEGFRFVAGLSGLDARQLQATGLPTPLSWRPKLRTSRVSPDGLHAAFTSTASPTGYDSTDLAGGEPAAEVFVYDATADGGTGELECASCNRSGARPQGRLIASDENGKVRYYAAAQIPGWTFQQRPTGALSADGERLFFNSYDALVLADTNSRADVYQWEAAGKGGCDEADSAFSPSNGGCVSLVSSGQSSRDSELVDATASGDDVFFLTLTSLLPQDTDLIDLYDARVNGGLPIPQGPPPGCEGEACQSPPAPPQDPTPASSSFQGAGNPGPAKAKPCPKGKVRRKGRCVKRHKKHAGKHKTRRSHR